MNRYTLLLGAILFFSSCRQDVTRQQEQEPGADELPYYVESVSTTKIAAQIDNYDTVRLDADELVVLHNPYKNKGAIKLSGTLHNHTDNSAGVDGYGSGEVSSVVTKFRDVGKFDFYAITDHNFFTPDPKVRGIINMGFAVEDTKEGQHLGVINLPLNVGDINRSEDANTLIDFYKNGCQAVVILNHPDWRLQQMPYNKLTSISRVDFVEVLNSAESGSERAFNILNNRFDGRVYGIGADDYHYNAGWKDPDMYFRKSWVEVYCDRKTRTDIWTHLLGGSFYATKGDTRMDVECSDGILRIMSEYPSTITFLGKGFDERHLSETVILKRVERSNASSYTIDGTEGYVYAKVENQGGVSITQIINIE
ncbi:hypothetical protein BN938_2721 [Mucinivorans hirudinis]|uniref:Polymerase/histidinol phosphatase N-terminal domain-containing protein n=1 Tax=Mucinivorans hirudinis TaxID=1433126 RepID=A0A060RAY2_9BACT|nr:hypothetical protein BN938_2721 [Mucinivorans hirudinis]